MSFFVFDIKNSISLVSKNALFIINCSFIIDIMISFHTGYYEKGIIIKDKKLIAIKYIKTALLSDVLGINIIL